MKKLFGVFICLFFSVILAACGGGSGPEAAAKKYVQAVYNGDADAVISMIYMEEKDKKDADLHNFLSGKIKEGVTRSKEMADKNGGISNIAVEEPKYEQDKNSANVVVKVQFKNLENPTIIELHLVKTNDGWMVSQRF